jgi:hypothetical protein
MAELKTKKTRASVTSFINSIEDPQKRADARALASLMRTATGQMPAMWGTSIVGFGSYDYKYPTGRTGTWPMTGFSPRKQNLTVYIMPGFAAYESLLDKLGPHTMGVSCLYFKRLSDVHQPTLKKLVAGSFKYMKAKYRAAAGAPGGRKGAKKR